MGNIFGARMTVYYCTPLCLRRLEVYDTLLLFVTHMRSRTNLLYVEDSKPSDSKGEEMSLKQKKHKPTAYMIVRDDIDLFAVSLLLVKMK